VKQTDKIVGRNGFWFEVSGLLKLKRLRYLTMPPGYIVIYSSLRRDFMNKKCAPIKDSVSSILRCWMHYYLCH